MNEKIIAHEISALLDKIVSTWNAAGRGQHGVSRIEKDIMMSDLRQLYDKLHQIDFIEKDEQAKKPVIQEQEPPSMMFSGTIPEMTSEQEPEFFGKYSRLSQEEEKNDAASLVFEKSSPAEQGVQQELITGQQFQKPKPAVKSTVEMFPPSKTIADKFQNSHDNSLAAKIQSNRISDIRSAIGVNEKFLFMRDIFDNDSSKYNEAIDYLDNTGNFYEALQYIDQLKAGKLNDDNKAAFAKLLDFSKRKFY
jgi:hypothetical protein